MPWGQFKAMFHDTEYRVQGGYCALASDLVVAMDDGSWYEQADNGYFYHRWAPTKKLGKSFSKIVGQSSSLEELNVDD